jgi:hypothetical protein
LADVAPRDEPIYLDNKQVGEETLQTILEWCSHHRHEPARVERKRFGEVERWDWDFIQRKSTTLFDVIRVSRPANAIAIAVLTILMGSNYLDIPGLLDLGCKSAARDLMNGSLTQQLPLPAELRNAIWAERSHYLLEHAANHSVFSAYVIQGGIQSLRHEKARALTGQTRFSKTLVRPLMLGLCRYSEQEKLEQFVLDIDAIQRLAQAGEDVRDGNFKIIDLGSCLRPDLTPVAESRGRITITIAATAVKYGVRLAEEARDSIAYALENTSARACQIVWGPATTELAGLPPFPPTLRSLTICNGMPFPGGVHLRPWSEAERVTENLRGLTYLCFRDCTVHQEDLLNLKQLLRDTKVEAIET